MRSTWARIPLVRSTASVVPVASGVYSIVRVQWVHGFPVDLEVLYAGQSLNLRRRFQEHAVPWREGNRVLRSTKLEGVEFWYREIPKAHLDVTERALIRALQPPANSILYGGTDNERN